MEHYQGLLHIMFAVEVMGWEDVHPSREDGKLRFYGTIRTNRGPQMREIPDYSNDLGAMWGAEQYLKSLGLGAAYLGALKDATGVSDASDPEDLFRLVSASPAQRCQAGLVAYRLHRT